MNAAWTLCLHAVDVQEGHFCDEKRAPCGHNAVTTRSQRSVLATQTRPREVLGTMRLFGQLPYENKEKKPAIDRNHVNCSFRNR